MKPHLLRGAAAVALVALAIPSGRAVLHHDATAHDDGPVLVRAPSRPAAWVKGSTDGTRLGLLSLRRSGPRVVTAKLRLVADRSVAGNVLDDRLDLDFLADGFADDVSGVRLVDEVHGRAIAPMRDGPDCVCSDVDGIPPRGSIDFYAKFLVEPGVDRVAVDVPTFAPFDGALIEPE